MNELSRPKTNEVQRYIAWSIYREASECASMLSAAIAYAEAGFSLVPVQRLGKHAIFTTLDGARATALPEHWNKYPNDNIGLMVTDEFWVLDVDGEQGQTSLEWLTKACHLDFSNEFKVKTGNGTHYYFSKLLEDRVPTCIRVLPGIDILGAGSMVIAPPSTHATSNKYQLVSTDEAESPNFAPNLLFELAKNAPHKLINPNAKDGRGEVP